MIRPALLALLLLLPALASGAAVEIMAVSPSAAVPGAEVSLRGGPLNGTVRVHLGQTRIRPARIYPYHLFFEVPELPAGEYSLRLSQSGEFSTSPFSFEVLYPKPAIRAINPWKVYACSSELERRIALDVEHFSEGAQVMLDGTILPHSRESDSRIAIELPELSEGLHEIRLVDAQGQQSHPSSLFIDATPHIFSMEVTDDRVSLLEIAVRGRNFYAASRLSVNDRLVGQGRPAAPLADELEYRDCTELLYLRHPKNSSPVESVVRIINPDGRQSPPYSISLR